MDFKQKNMEEKISEEETKIREEIKTRKELFDQNVDVAVKRFKDDPKGLKEVMESSQKIIDGDPEILESLKISEDPDAILREKNQSMYEMRMFEEALKIIESKQE